MSVHFISGKPGGGKTLYSLRLILDELLHGDRLIVTNVPLRFPELNAYLQERYDRLYQVRFIVENAVNGIPLHLKDRIRIITEDELTQFFTFRGNGVRLAGVSNEDWRKGVRPDYSTVKDSGVFYVLDEVHIAFNSRAWALTGNEVLYYLSQHRKLGDDVVCITQSVNNVDKQFRSVAQDYTYIRNLSKQRAGFMRLPAMFVRSTYAGPFTPTSTAMESGTFKLDVSGLAACYDTAKGVGIHGRAGADTRARKKGISWIWFVIGLPLLLWVIFHWLPIILAHKLGPQVRPGVPVKHVESVPAAVPAFVQVPVPSTVVVTQFVYVAAAVPGNPVPEVFCTGYAGSAATGFVVLFSDGSQATTKSGRVTKIMQTYVVCDGVRYPIKAAAVVSIVPSVPTNAVRRYSEEVPPVIGPGTSYVTMPVNTGN